MRRTREIEIDLLVAHEEELAIGSPAGEFTPPRWRHQAGGPWPILRYELKPIPEDLPPFGAVQDVVAEALDTIGESKDFVRHHRSPDSGAAFSSLAPAPPSPKHRYGPAPEPRPTRRRDLRT